jgi:hypothetical protein
VGTGSLWLSLVSEIRPRERSDFAETSTEQNIGTLYIQQRAFKTQPKKIRVTVEVIS